MVHFIMRKVILFTLLSITFRNSDAGLWSNCIINELDEGDWLMSYTIEKPIEDTYEGIIAKFTTTNITEVAVVEGKYLDATFENETITIYTNENFKNFEKEAKQLYDLRLTIRLNFLCVDQQEDTLTIYQEVTDVNNHEPVFNENTYSYCFGMSIPEDFEFTNLLPIYATDDDFTNQNVYFTIEWNEYIKLGYKGYFTGHFHKTSLTALKNLVAPFEREFTLVATDTGNPARNSTAKLIISISESTSKDNSTITSNTTEIHPPVFTQHLYFANYTVNHDLILTEPIIIKYGLQNDTIIKQSAYEEYFHIAFKSQNKSELEVRVIKQLPETLLKDDTLVVEIEAENPGLAIPARTALIIRITTNNINNECHVVHIWGYTYNTSVLPIMFSISALFIVVFLNVIILSLYYKKRENNMNNTNKI